MTWLGLIWAMNLFGVAATHARQVLASTGRRRWFAHLQPMPFEHAFRMARTTGVGFMIFSLLWVLAGVLEFTRGDG